MLAALDPQLAHNLGIAFWLFAALVGIGGSTLIALHLLQHPQCPQCNRNRSCDGEGALHLKE